ncbi:hypothetical protein [Streptosporangium roseum]|uniref:hypothetical protein n=1 Tax=Streptosporangium roseum TaxID=2001 RepID=UPI0012DFE276|nr:hypothetical protein [Streptosporangium roseum]
MWKFRNPSDEYERDTADLTFETPAMGDGFAFQVTVRCARNAGVRHREAGAWPSMVEEKANVHDLVRGIVREVCRRTLAFNPEQAEEEVNGTLATLLTDRRWSVRVEVDLTEEVRRLQQDSAVAQHGTIAKAEIAALRVRKLDELSRECERFLSAATINWETLYAVRLAECPEAAADILADMLKDRQESAESLVRLVQTIADAQHSANVFDLVIASDTALRTALQRLGVPVPARADDPLLPL